MNEPKTRPFIVIWNPRDEASSPCDGPSAGGAASARDNFSSVTMSETGPEQVVAGRYRLVRVLGEGATALVWEATDNQGGPPVAIKFLKSTANDDRRRFAREARAIATIDHPNVVRVHSVVQDDGGRLGIVMDLLRGETLGVRLRREARLDAPTAARIFLPVISAVSTAHARNIVHRDLKPDNVFLVDGHEPRVLDFGVAKILEDENGPPSMGLTRTGALLGTPYYMSPEQVFGEKDIDPRSDVWAIGVMLYESLAGRRPFEAPGAGSVFRAITSGKLAPFVNVAPNAPKALADLVGRMLVFDRAARLHDLNEAALTLSKFTTL